MTEIIGTLPWIIMMIFWLSIIGFFFTLFARFVRAVEKIADNLSR